MSTSLCVCLCECPRGYLQNHTHDFIKCFVHVADGRGSVLLRLCSDTLCTSGFVDDIMFVFTELQNSALIKLTSNNHAVRLTRYKQTWIEQEELAESWLQLTCPVRSPT